MQTLQEELTQLNAGFIQPKDYFLLKYNSIVDVTDILFGFKTKGSFLNEQR